MAHEPLRALVDKLIGGVAYNLSFGIQLPSTFSRHGGSFSYNNCLFYVDLWFNGTWMIEIRKYLVRSYNCGVTVIRVNLDDPLLFEKLEAFIGVSTSSNNR